MSYLFTSESVSEGHPDKIADQISDALLDEFLRRDPASKVAIETLVTTGLVMVAGEVQTEAWVDHQAVIRKTLGEIGYTHAEYQFEANSCGIISTIHEQSSDIRQGVDRNKPEDQGAGDQGMMFGYACREQDNFMPLPIEIAHDLLFQLADIRHHHIELMPYLRPDAKSQVTMQYDDSGTPVKIDTIVISTQHDEFIKSRGDSVDARADADHEMREKIREDIVNILIPKLKDVYAGRSNQNINRLFEGGYKLHVNPTGKFVIGGPHGDSGLTGRKIIVDTYGGRGAHGGGAFSGKDSSKVDRSAAYAARHIAKNMVAAGVADEVLVQVAYAIGVAKPVGLYVNTYGTGKARGKDGSLLTDSQIAERIHEIFDLKPYAIITRLGLKNPIYLPTATYGHFGRDPYTKAIKLCYDPAGNAGKSINCKSEYTKTVEFFSWEKLDYLDTLQKEFRI